MKTVKYEVTLEVSDDVESYEIDWAINEGVSKTGSNPVVIDVIDLKIDKGEMNEQWYTP